METRTDSLVMGVLKIIAEQKGFTVREYDFNLYNSRLKGNKIGLRKSMSKYQKNYCLAYQLARVYLGIADDDSDEPNEMATKCADFVIDTVSHLALNAFHLMSEGLTERKDRTYGDNRKTCGNC